MSRMKVRFCTKCAFSLDDGCNKCEKLFYDKPRSTFHQVKEDITTTSYVCMKKTNMIADLGCPNTVISANDAEVFANSLTEFQRDNLEYIEVKENFKFGPSGPFKCIRKLRFPIKKEPKPLWAEVALVQADIPMLLGNNIFKPLGAEFKLFPEGDGILKLQDTEIQMKETTGGHYTVKVSDLGKVCATVKSSVFCSESSEQYGCGKCGKKFRTQHSLKEHMQREHRASIPKTCKKCEKDFCSGHNLKIHMQREHRASIPKTCKKCEKDFCSGHNLKIHMESQHRVSIPCDCDICGKSFRSGQHLNDHTEGQHKPSMLKNVLKKKTATEEEVSENLILTDLNTLLNGSPSNNERKMILAMKKLVSLEQTRSEECKSCIEMIIQKKDLNVHKATQHGEHFECDACNQDFEQIDDLQNHISSPHELDSQGVGIGNVFLLHHEEEQDDKEFEFNLDAWNILMNDTDEKCLTREEERDILKLHKYFAHRSGKKLWENLLQPSGKLKGKKRLVLEYLNQCEICSRHKKTPARPKVGLPKAKDVNDVVSMDLKIMKKSGKKEVAILYLHDEFTKMIKGQVINDKQKDTIIKAIEKKWIVGDGMGPGHPSRGFFTDNGGEFLNSDMIDFAAALDISIKMTAASGPWMNGSCERAHATVDRIVEKILDDEPNTDLQKAVDRACFVKNMEINKTGFSPLQLFCGRSPSFPGYSDCTPSSIELEGNNEYLMILKRLDDARKLARQVDCDQRIKVALKSKINHSLNKSYKYGDPIWFKLNSAHKWKSGNVLAQDGKVLFIRYGNFLRRIPIDHVVPAEEHTDDDDKEIDEDEEISPEDEENKERLMDDSFDDLSIVVQKDKEIETLKKAIQNKDTIISELESKVVTSAETDVESVHVKRNVQNLPSLYQRIRFKQFGNPEVLAGKVVRVQKKKSKHRNTIGIKLENGIDADYDFSKNIEHWQDKDEEPVVSLGEPEELTETFATVLTKAEVKGNPEADKAMQDEIKKFEDFGAFERVVDKGQYAIKTRWVYTVPDDNSKGYSLKARLCMRGDTEENRESIRADSPTANKDSLKLALAIAANEGFDIMSGDIKSAFLQGQALDRNVLVVPPPEANDGGKLWLLKKAAYGLIDGSRLFYLELKNKLEKLGLKMVSADSALFTLHRSGKLVGIVCMHVDDLFMTGNSHFKQIMTKELATFFKFSKVEEHKFKFLGCEIEKHANGDITLNQSEYISKIEEVIVPEKTNSCLANTEEKKEIRRVVGELLWVSLMTRPDLSFEVNSLSSNITKANIKDLKDARRLVEKAKSEPISLNFTRLGSKDKLKIRMFSDASFSNQDNKLRSTEGRVVLLENEASGKSNLFSWKTKKISRICRSVKGAETRALENGLDDAIHFARMVREIYDGHINLKDPKQINVEALTDNKGLWDNLHNSRQCDEKMLRNSVALMKEMMDNKEVKKIDWVDTTKMLADILTKRNGNGTWIKRVISTNVV